MKHVTKELFHGVLFLGGLIVMLKLVTMVPAAITAALGTLKTAAQAAGVTVGGNYSGGTTGTSYTGSLLDGGNDTDSGGASSMGGFSPIQFVGDKKQP